jgi:hypothetical protein
MYMWICSPYVLYIYIMLYVVILNKLFAFDILYICLLYKEQSLTSLLQYES